MVLSATTTECFDCTTTSEFSPSSIIKTFVVGPFKKFKLRYRLIRFSVKLERMPLVFANQLVRSRFFVHASVYSSHVTKAVLTAKCPLLGLPIHKVNEFQVELSPDKDDKVFQLNESSKRHYFPILIKTHHFERLIHALKGELFKFQI